MKPVKIELEELTFIPDNKGSKSKPLYRFHGYMKGTVIPVETYIVRTIDLWANEFGMSVEEAKTLIKKQV